MAGDEACDNITVLLQNDTLPSNSLWIPTSSATLHGAKSMVNFENVGGGDTVDGAQFLQPSVKEEIGDDDFDICLNPRGKKRRLSASQVQFLERNFEVENKLEPERKIQLAVELGLQPRQVAIWFQNRRARFKNKQLEKDYNFLKSSYDKLKLDYDQLLKEKENLKNQLVALKEKFSAGEGKRETEPVGNCGSDEAVNAKMVSPKQEDATTSSAKSDVFDSDSPHSYLGPAESSQVFDQSGFSQDEGDHLPSQQYYSKAYHEPHANSCNFEFPAEDQPFWCWSY